MFVLVFVTVTLSIFVYYLQKGKEIVDYKGKDNNTNGTFQTKVGNMDEIKLDKDENKEPSIKLKNKKQKGDDKNDFEVRIE